MVIQLDFEAEEQDEQVLSDFPEGELLEITKVERQKKSDHRYIIHFGAYNMTVHEDVMIKYRMITGNSFMKADLEEIVVADERQRAYVEGLRYLERKPRTAMEMTRRLRQKEIGETIIAEVVQRLQQERFLDDPLYAKQWAEQRIANQRKGKMWIRQELREKGIDKTLISEALENITPEQELESALETGRKKWNLIRGDASDKRRKTGAFLMRRGFSGDMVRQVINTLLAEDNYEGEDEEFY
ncbi:MULTISPECIES: RecX family transcriptional regulator [Paenibacillus]|uniref:regulatory protein RecX n=1 Tax=Paenibacillus TaxID=44249 RepID=UPI0003E25EFD|nr:MULTISPECIES: RecX family transcriptional regulator [Paenibacillus]ETT45875.1 regulatory protein recX [Paenibacillus sp. FSL H8-237]MEC0133261.1 RecX family transcriptional regulator [Paenibacillus odorifer]MEC0223294.1 RecX family transcriptional regulator [Paenibacillus odorifer]OMC94813.1 RecX family transcriptional regulator [Paenibacillus odorifer]OMC95232.1 RecX family transcriptional regulator [Paenibacillus odorifer]